jgi:hypothetical protein
MPDTNYRRFVPSGFHGDIYLQALVKELADRSKAFIETGTNVGSTLRYTAQKYPHLECLSCEPDEYGFGESRKNTKGLSNVKILNVTSQGFMKNIQLSYRHLFNLPTLFWLDAHDFKYEWPLLQEMAFVTHNWKTAYILIDDFSVPGLSPEITQYNFENIKRYIKKDLKYDLYYPNYTEKTSPFHPLVYWCLIVFGDKNPIDLPKIRKV